MPNWCENELTISGRTGVLACLAAIKSEPDEGDDGQPRCIDFQRIVPMPEDADGIECWGTEWNACKSCLLYRATNKRADIGFETAWSPPLPVIIALSKQFATLSFTLRYWEAGCSYSGILRVKNGRTLQNNCFDYFGSRGG